MCMYACVSFQNGLIVSLVFCMCVRVRVCMYVSFQNGLIVCAVFCVCKRANVRPCFRWFAGVFLSLCVAYQIWFDCD